MNGNRSIRIGLWLWCVCIPFWTQAMRVEKLWCELAEHPAWIAEQHPRLGWVLASHRQGDRQRAYQIRVATDRALLEQGGDCWNTGRVEDSCSQFIPYAGKALEGGRNYYWQVRVWDADGKASPWSPVGTWETALPGSAWKAQWIGAIRREDANLPEGRDFHTLGITPEKDSLWDRVEPLAKQSILLRKAFNAGKMREAKLYISGLGQYDLYINGRRVDPASVFKPLWSEYDKTVYYNTYDIGALLKEGENVIGVALGNGMYNVAGGRYTKFRGSFGPPTLIAQLELTGTDGVRRSVLSDTTWRYVPGPVTFNCIFGGEDYDAALEQPGWNAPGFDDAVWLPVVVQEAPSGRLTAQDAPPVTVARRYGVKKAKEVAPGRWFFDMGQNLAGFPTIRVRGARGQKVRLVLGDVLDASGEKIDQEPSGAPYYLEYTLKGEGIEEWAPVFTYYGYQYIEIDGIDYRKKRKGSSRPVVLELSSGFIHSSAPENGSFHCSNELFNRIHGIIGMAARSNMQSVFTDCPHREKLGWLEETHLNGPGLLFNYDLRRFYLKLMRDIADTQSPDGLVPDIAPEYVRFAGGFRDSPEWGAAAAMIPWLYYQWYGDDALIRGSYPVMRRYADYLSSRADGYILSHGLGDWYDHGPRGAGTSQNTPKAITATGHYYLVVRLTAEAAELAGDREGAERYGTLAERIREAYNERLFDPQTRQYGSGSQCSNALPLWLGIVPDSLRAEVAEHLAADIEKRGGRLSTGDVGNRYLYQTLAASGRNDLMYRMHNHTEVPGYGFQVALGVTTLAEQWDPRKGMSWNHFMMGQIEEWFYQSLGGIRPDPASPGFRHFFVEPVPVGDLTAAEARYESMYGTIRLAWRVRNGTLRLEVGVPVNTEATLILPGRDPVRLVSGDYVFKEAWPHHQ